MTSDEHPVILKFSGQADEILALMRNEIDFAGICQDYAQIVGDITRQERSTGHDSAILTELLRLRSDLERDIVDYLCRAELKSQDGP